MRGPRLVMSERCHKSVRWDVRTIISRSALRADSSRHEHVHISPYMALRIATSVEVLATNSAVMVVLSEQEGAADQGS